MTESLPLRIVDTGGLIVKSHRANKEYFELRGLRVRLLQNRRHRGTHDEAHGGVSRVACAGRTRDLQQVCVASAGGRSTSRRRPSLESIMDKASGMSMEIESWRERRRDVAAAHKRHLLAMQEGRAAALPERPRFASSDSSHNAFESYPPRPQKGVQMGRSREKAQWGRARTGKEDKRLRTAVEIADRQELKTTEDLLYIVLVNLNTGFADVQIKGTELIDGTVNEIGTLAGRAEMLPTGPLPSPNSSQEDPPAYSERDAEVLFSDFHSAPSVLEPLRLPLCVPQATAGATSLFTRAYTPELRASGVELDDWIHFVDALNIAMTASPPLRVVDAAGLIIGFVTTTTFLDHIIGLR
ncbi:hypothetical protein EW145_g3965 [Phellinidium pouzarii]|uniref:Uncharacterized protein n=1 Tax=Phellinidium pouzarii TaxID=167371 RepID=A0A4S4L6P7_9AGAM|nr:hypothetical protein EW145_g3965 [Phellinidium pouzarii]